MENGVRYRFPVFLRAKRARSCAKRRIFVGVGTDLQDSERRVARFSHKNARNWHRTQLSMRNSDSAAFFGPENSFYRQN